MKQITEAAYPDSFRAQDTQGLGKLLSQRTSVVLVGMKRVGINNFLRFFMSHAPLITSGSQQTEKVLFISIDLNDLVEREIYPFWVLFLRRLTDSLVETSIAEDAKKEAQKLFTDAIQLKDLFFTIDSVQKIIKILVENGYYPIVFLLRFDRLKEAVTQEFFNNLQGVKESAHQKMAFVFTSFRPLHHLSPDVFKKAILSGFSVNYYLKPANVADIAVIYESLKARYQVSLSENDLNFLVSLSGGHVHYLQILLHIYEQIKPLSSERAFIEKLAKDEEIMLLSEELFANLTKIEQEVVTLVSQKITITPQQRESAHYLWDTGIITDHQTIFSPLFEIYISHVNQDKSSGGDFTRKENVLFSLLKSKEGFLCEREEIVDHVWPEQSEAGVSDWAVDRLVARVRAKLKAQNSEYEIVTVITRGYKLVKKM